MAPATRPGDGSKSTFLPSDQKNAQSSASRTAPNVRGLLPPYQPGRPLQQTTQQQFQRQRQQLPLPHNRIQNMSRPNSLAEAYRPEDMNYTSVPMRYPMNTSVNPDGRVTGAPGLHKTHPLIGFPPVERVQNIPPRFIASDMMEAIFLGDPGHFLTLDDGIRYYMWRRLTLKMQGKSVLTDRLYPNLPEFQFDFKTKFGHPHPQLGTPFLFTSQVKRGTYAYFYRCWRTHTLQGPNDKHPSAGISTVSRDLADVAQNSHANGGLSLESFLHTAGFWDEFGPGVYKLTDEGALLRSRVVSNMTTFMDIAWQEIMKATGKHVKFPNGRDDAISYIEGSMAFWGNPDWQCPADFTPTKPEAKIWHFTQTLFPYVAYGDKYAQRREAEIRKTLPELQDHTSSTQIRVEPKKKKELGLRPVTTEEADFMDEILDYTDCGEVEEEEDVDMTG